MLRKMRTFKIKANNEPIHTASLHYFSRVSWISNRFTRPPPVKLAHVSHIDRLITNIDCGSEEPICPCGLYVDPRLNAHSTTKQWNQIVKWYFQGD